MKINFKKLILATLVCGLGMWISECSAENLSKRTVMIPMRDGIKLATNLYFPKNENGPFPVILMRTPYNKEILK